MFDDENIIECGYLLSISEYPYQAILAWQKLDGQHPDLSGIVGLEDYQQKVIPYAVAKYTKAPYEYMVPYFSSDSLYFIDDNILKEIEKFGEANIEIEYSLMLDTNIASYIDKLVRGKSLGSVHSQVISFINELLHDGLNFDALFYMVENVKTILHVISKDDFSKINFWKSLSKDFRSSLVSYQVFRSIDTDEYRKTSNPKPKFTYKYAAREAIEYCYEFYYSTLGKEHILKLALIQRLVLLQILGMVRIELASKRSAKKKMQELFSFIHNTVGAYLDRESIIAHQYFLDRKNIPFLEKIKLGMPTKRLLKKLDNIAWDMVSPRLMEKMILEMGRLEQRRYFVPMFVSFDKNLREYLKLFL